MLERDLAAAPPTTAVADHGGSSEQTADLLSGMVLQLIRHRAEDQLARYELSLEASRRPELLDAITHGGRVLREHLAGMLGPLGIRDPEQAAWPFAAMLDGLLWDRVAGAGRTLSEDAFEAAVRRAVRALLEGFRTD
jgi:hypothetical protein